jgi:hypothetical protein
MTLKPSTAVEKVVGNPLAQTAATAIAAMNGGPLAALLPVLLTTLASERQKKRIEAALIEIDSQLQSHTSILRNISDSQYKLINESILALLQTTCDKKVTYLHQAINNVLQMNDLPSHEATYISRILRDISAQEVVFILENFQYSDIQLITSADSSEKLGNPEFEKVLYLRIGSEQGRLVTSLTSLGIIATAGTRFMDAYLYKFMPITGKLITLLKIPKNFSN